MSSPVVKDDEDVHELTEEQEAEIEAGLAEIDRGDWVDGDCVIADSSTRPKL